MKKLFKMQVGMNDMWLFIYLALQLVHIVLSIFLPLPANSDKEVIDVVMRTSTAVLAGYFVSKNFIDKKPVIFEDVDKQTRNMYQTTIVGVIGLFSLCLTLVVRYVDVITLPYNTLAQVRDFYLASVAFLMGTSSQQ